MNYIQAILYKYPTIEKVTYWETQYDGTPWADPYDGLIWENQEHPKPTKEEIEAWILEYDLLDRQKIAVSQRQYPSLGDQLDMIYKDKINNTNLWVDLISKIKAAHPKPTE